MKGFISSIFSGKNKMKNNEEAEVVEVDAQKEVEEVDALDVKRKDPSHVTVSEEDLERLVALNNKLAETKMQLGQMLINYREKKEALMGNVEALNNTMKDRVEALKEQYGIEDSQGEYLLNLSTGGFVRKDAMERAQQKAESARKGE